MRPPRGLSAGEAELWLRVARTVTPLPRAPSLTVAVDPEPAPIAPKPPKPMPRPDKSARMAPVQCQPQTRPQPRPLDRHGLDGSWERKLQSASIQPDFTLDLHGHNLESAHARLDHGLAQAAAMGARLVLVITGKPRPVAAADRSEQRGAIRAKLLDWLAAGPHASRIAAVRGAHRRHGGSGAVYVVMKKPR